MRRRESDAADPSQPPVIVLREEPDVYLTAVSGKWLLRHSTTSWRQKDPEKGFQRIVNTDRAKAIARTVLDEHRTFPNAITLATKTKSFKRVNGHVVFPDSAKFLVVDGQHRLWAQKYSEVDGTYPCVIHMDRTEPQMAKLFLEINANQRRVPSSLRWDLYRLVEEDVDQATVMTSELVYALATERESPFAAEQQIDLTGEDTERRTVTIRQGSLAPEIRTLLKRSLKKNPDFGFGDYLSLLIRFFTAIRSLDPDGWDEARSPFFKARVLRAMLRVLDDMMQKLPIEKLTTLSMRKAFAGIKPETLSDEAVRKAQGSAGVRDLYTEISRQVHIS
jgi:DGQHR domain-containing protein